MKEYKCEDKYGPGVVVRAPETCCLFCKHCTDIFWDYTNGPYWMFCEKHDNITKVGGHVGNCPDFQEEEKGGA